MSVDKPSPAQEAKTMVTETDRNKARSAVVSAYHALDCVTIPFSFLHAFADAAVDAVSTDAEPVAYVSRKCLDQLHAEGSHVAVQTAIHRVPLRSGNGVPLYAEPVKTAPAVAVKAGWALVPILLTKEMCDAVDGVHETGSFNDRWEAAIAASPALSAQVQDVAETLEAYYQRQIEWSSETFGPALRTKGIIDHIKKELREIEADPHDLSEWIDVVILAMDGFWRHGGNAEDLFKALIAKQQKTWPALGPTGAR